jgi:pimeloyl-ACP methyl ester carboxylesterase
MVRTPFTVATPSGQLSGWFSGQGQHVLVVHGGPGMNYDYLDDAVTELAARYTVATFQQRGLAPSTTEGEYTIDEAVADVAAVLDGLGWDTAYVMGHSWGGHLVFHVAAAIPERVDGVLSVDPLGAVGDGGAEAFGAELIARLPEADQERARILAEKDATGESTMEDDLEGLALVWPSYYGDPAAAPAMPPVSLSQHANRALWADLQARLPELEASLPSITVPVGVLVGELSPMPPSAGTDSAERVPGAWSHVEPGAGHFVWYEAPGCVLAAMDRLVAGG